MITIGLDLSLVKTGIVIIQDDGKVLYSGLVKSKPSGDKPIDETRRIKKIAEDIFNKIDEILDHNRTQIFPELVAIEGLAFLSVGTSLVQLAGLNYLTRILLEEFGWKFVIIAPTTLKKFITGSGRGEKDMVTMAVYKNYGFEAGDNNISDAFGLAACAMALLGKPLKEPTKQQLEVINLLKKQL